MDIPTLESNPNRPPINPVVGNRILRTVAGLMTAGGAEIVKTEVSNLGHLAFEAAQKAQIAVPDITSWANLDPYLKVGSFLWLGIAFAWGTTLGEKFAQKRTMVQRLQDYVAHEQ